MNAGTAKRFMVEAQRRRVRGAPMQKALALISDAARHGNPGVNFTVPSRSAVIDPLADLDTDLQAMLAEELRQMGYEVVVTAPDLNCDRSVESFVVTWGNAKEEPEPFG